jgi:hypothetical protein
VVAKSRIAKIALGGLIATCLLGFCAPPAIATGYNSVVSTGLVMNFDASSSNSYSSNTWTDTTGHGHNASFTAGAYSSNNGGYLSFNGTSTYGNIGSLLVTDTFTSGMSTTFYANFGATTQTWERIFDFGNGAGNNNILVGRSSNSDALWYEIYNATGSSIGTCSAANAIQDNAWAWYAISTNGSTCSMYVNGVSQTVSASGGGSTLTVTPATIARANNYIGRSNWSPDGYFDSGIGKLAIYNRGLSPAEVYQNYQAQADTCNATQGTTGGWTTFSIKTVGTCQWFRPTAATSAEALIVAGGGGGGFDVAGGGGAGGLLYYGAENPKTPNGAAINLNQESYTVTVGGGGTGSTSITANGSNGSDSSFNGNVAKGGGAGNSRNVGTTAPTGGSGGGGAYNSGATGAGNNGGSGTANQGTSGGNGSVSADAGGGGGGAGAAGAVRSGGSSTGAEGKGGDGLSYSITGTATYYAGGGGGGSYNSVGGKGGLGGGGHGGNSTLATCQTIFTDCGATEVLGRQGKSGVANTGGGGGGSGNENVINYPGDGGSGVVILRFVSSLVPSAVNSISFSAQVKKLLANTITATVSLAGKVSFFANGRPIPRCANIATTAVSPFTAQCVWKPLTHGQVSVTTTFVPDDISYNSASGGTTGVATKRTTSR